MSLILPSPTKWRFRHRNADGEIIWASGVGELDRPILPGSHQLVELDHDQPWKKNMLTDLGEGNILNVYFRANATPTGFYIGLSQSNEATLTETITLGSINEVTGTGYARQSVARSTGAWGAPSGTNPTTVAQSAAVTFSASGTWSAALSAFITDSSTGTTDGGAGAIPIVVTDLSASRTLASGETLDVDFTVGAS